MPRQVSGTGRITQWIAVCRCDSLIEQTDLPMIEVCARCGKRVEPGRAGSLTQWIFRSDICPCEVPEPIKTAVTALPASLSAASSLVPQVSDDAEELQVPGDQFPLERYGPLAVLGKGASGCVYMCKDRLLNKRVAVKVLHSISPEKSVAFQREAKAVSKLANPGIVKILDFGVSASATPYMVLECVNGISLDQYLRQFKRLDQVTTARVFSILCEALSYAHKNDIYHRDLKPSNILVTLDGDTIATVCLIDFGVAQIKNEKQEPTLIRGNEVTGTPAYMSPDQITNARFDSRSEVYSLGCVMFEALIGEPPFLGDTALDTMTMHLSNDPRSLAEAAPALEPEGWHPMLEEIVARCLRKEPEERWQNFRELDDQLKAFRSEMGFVDEVVPVKQNTDNRILAASIAGFLVIALIGGQQFFSRASESKKVVAPDATKIERRFNEVWQVRRVKGEKFARDNTSNVPSKIDDSEEEVPYAPRVSRGSDVIFNARELRLLQDKSDRDGGDEDDDDSVSNTAGGGRPKLELCFYPVEGVALTDKDLLLLKGRNVYSVSLINQKYVTDRGLAALKGLPITRLNVSYTNITDAGMKHISALKELEILNVSGCPKLTAAGFKHISDLSNLRSLHMEDLKVDDQIAPYIRKLKTLEKIFLEHTNISDATVAALVGLNLYEVRLVDCNSVTDKGMEELTKLPDTRVIEVGSPLVTDKGFEKLARRFNDIRKIRLEGCTRVGDKSMALIASRYPRLKELKISDTATTPAGIKEVAKLGELSELRLASMNFKDADLLPLLKLSRLEVLDLTDDHFITDESAYALAQLPSLKRILLHTSGVTPKGVQYLKQHTKAEVYGSNLVIDKDRDTTAIFQEIGD